MATLKRDTRLTSLQTSMCAGLAGVLSRTVTAPLDVVKVLTQVGTFHSKEGFLRTFPLLYQAEGIKVFWKGNFTACIRLFPYRSVQLAAYHKFVLLLIDDVGQISQWKAIAAGGLAGIVATIVTYPTDVIKTRLIVQNSRYPSYRGIVHALCSMYYQEGFRSLYRGVSLTILGAVPFSVGSFATYTSLDKIWKDPSTRFTLLQNFVTGCIAAGVAQTLSFPFETVKRKMQAQSSILPHCGGVDVHFTGMLDCFKQIVKTQGIQGLWSGLTVNLLKIVPYFGLMFSTFEFCKRLCLYRNGYIVSPLNYQLAPGVDQSLQPQELKELRKFLRTENAETRKSPLKS